MIESINFATDVISQETTHTEIIGFTNAPDFLSKTLAWLLNLPINLIAFPIAISEAQREKSSVFNRTDGFLQQLLDIEWRLADSSFLILRDLQKEIGESFDKMIQSKWLSDVRKIKESIDITKRRVS